MTIFIAALSPGAAYFTTKRLQGACQSLENPHLLGFADRPRLPLAEANAI
jgi:hypothetical protein